VNRDGDDEGVMNTVCPVCGMPIPADGAAIEIGPEHQHPQRSEDHRLGAFRVCSEACARRITTAPEPYRVAARANRVADVDEASSGSGGDAR
jgi:hypothetical protein